MSEKRAISSQVRTVGEGDEKKVSGLGIVYDQWVELWPGVKERINKGAAKSAPLVKSFYNHDPSKVLSTQDSSPALHLEETDEGIRFTSPIPPTTYGKDLEINLERGNVRGASFAFDIPRGGDRMWEDENGILHREINELHYEEIGPVTNPAYIATTAQMRSTKEAVENWRANREPEKRNLRERRQKLIEGEVDL